MVAIDGSEIATFSVPEGTCFAPTTPGLFTAVAKDAMLRVAVNVFDGGVTRVNVAVGTCRRRRSGGATRPALTPWRWLLTLALLLLFVEWWTWNRRITV